MGIRKPFKAAVIEFNPCLNNLDDNIHNLLHAVTEAAKNGAKLIVTPEMATTGYHYGNRQAIQAFVDTIPGKTTNAFEKVANQYHTHIVIGLAEVAEDGIFYNSAALIGPEGYIGKYRKIHQWAAEDTWASWGDMGVPVYETEIGNISMIICMDASYFESARLAALNGADLLCFPTNSTGGTLSMLQAWAEINGIYVLGANRSNTENGYHMIGASTIWSPMGEKLVEAPYIEAENPKNERTILYSDIDPSKYNNPAKNRMAKRRPNLYTDLMLYSGPWNETKPKQILNNKKCSALLQYTPVIGEKKENLKKIKKMISEAVTKALDEGCSLALIVCPELSLAGPVHSLDIGTIQQLGETEDDETFCEMKRLARVYNLHIVFGMVEKEQQHFYNSTYVLAPNGEIAAKARKIHLTDVDEGWAEPGEEIVVADLKGIGRVGIMVGSDAAYPEIAGVMAVHKVDFIFIPSSWYGEFGQTLSLHEKMMENKYPDNSMTTWDAIARFSQAQTLVANFTGTSLGCKGGSALYTLDPIYGGDLPKVASPDREEVLIVPLSQNTDNWWFDQRKLLLTRRTHYYRELIKNNHPIKMQSI
ncbi:nitrilase-related carbon-nitrogen hydrolase [Bacillus salipaludis]|uniref:nitrilase-related carbon-nitrogen hydrolase n=1 Tax=Bacillus salipaludis TaxID=2547811 RepID=UPI002E215B81|nr:nitrilase-related carbon-nitrogen hydrolase [Bacillus salipaludis]